jgi:hypothetical protein
MKELKKSSSNHHINNHHNKNHHRSENTNNNINKDSVIWTIPSVTVHLEVKIDLHKMGGKIIS